MSARTRRLAATEVAQAAALLRDGQLVAFPTETVYGLGANATSGTAVAAIYAAKNRPSFNPLIAHYASGAAAFDDVTPTPLAERLAAAFWPGPLTLVLPRRAGCAVSQLAGAGLDTQAVRVPAHPLAHRLLAAVGRPVAAPSANPSGRVSPTTAEHVLDGLDGRIAAVLDGGPCAVGLESTVVDLSGERPTLLRAGGVTLEALRAVVPAIAVTDHDAGATPRLPLRLDAVTVDGTEALLAFGVPLTGAAVVYSLSDRGDLTQAAARLFAGLRHLDAEGRVRGLRGIAAMPIPPTGLGRAINDRLQRAATHPG
jgi:L-threonylcarbamoyladenylate synthase